MEYKLLSGETINVPPQEADRDAFYRRALDAASDPRVSVQEMYDLVYGLENPMLDKTIMPGRATVTLAVHNDPLWIVLQDLIGRKRIATGHLDLARSNARYTMTVSEAAKKLGVSSSAVRQAIAARRLDAIKPAGEWLLDPNAVEAYRVAEHKAHPQRGEQLEARIGSVQGLTFRIRGASVEGSREGAVRAGMIPAGWESIAVQVITKDRPRFFRLRPGRQQNELKEGGFYLRGPFDIAEHVEEQVTAVDAFKAHPR